MLSNPFWQRVFGGEKDAVGKTVQLDGETYTVIGVAPPNFGQTSKVDLWMPMAFSPEERSNKYRGAHYLNVAGRLKPASLRSRRTRS
ncbi:MAG: ABC transporter permease [Chthoniobacterales bacterium]